MKYLLAFLPILLAPAPTPADLIANVNTVRAQYGLPGYITSTELMEAAQKHSDYQAAQGQGTHTGDGSSTPTGRAKASGFGGGQTVWISENIAWGFSMSAPRSVEIWKQDGPHLLTMLSHYTHAGVGMAVGDNGVTYYTLVAGWIAGAPGTGMSNPQPDGSGGAYDAGAASAPPAAATAGPNADSGSSAPAINPVVAATPDELGRVVHVVESGQALYTIAVVYDIALEALLNLNDLTENAIIRPGDEIVISAGQLTATPDLPQAPAALGEVGSSASLLEPTPGSPSLDPTPPPTSAAALMQQSSAARDGSDEPIRALATGSSAVESFRTLGQIALVVLVFVAGGLVLLGNLQDKR